MKKLLTIAILFLFLVSCAPVYIPNSVNVPLFKKKNQTRISGYIGTSGVEIQGAYSVTNHLYLLANGRYVKGEIGFFDEIYCRSAFGEVGGGWYHSLGKKFICEISSGAGYGSSYARYDIDDWLSGGRETTIIQGNFTRYFIQSGIGYSPCDYFTAGVCCRYSFINFPVYLESHDHYYRFDTYKTNQQGYFLEPAIFISVGGKRIKATEQFGLSLFNDFNSDFSDHIPFIISFGVNINLGKLEK